MRIAVAHSPGGKVDVLRKAIMSVPGHEIVWVTENGATAVEKSADDTPDLLLMDLDLQGPEGAEATRRIMRQSPCAILIVTSSVSEKAAKAFEIMGNGALDVADMPVIDEKGHLKGAAALLKKIATIEKLIRREKGPGKGGPWPEGVASAAMYPMVAIGSSTGGPKALAEILSHLPKQLGACIVLVQHLDVQFAQGLVEWLSGLTGFRVVLAGAGIRPEKDTVFVAGTNDHLILEADGTFRYVPEPRDYPYRPSVDRFFFSIRDYWPGKGVAVLLTGMGRDGARGLLALHKEGWRTIAQDEKTSVVYGMPKAAVELGAAVDILPIEEVAGAITKEIIRMKGIKTDDHK
jgi:two-component system, chemotaxis family, response regulator WspF